MPDNSQYSHYKYYFRLRKIKVSAAKSAKMFTVAREARDATESSNVRFTSNKKPKSCLKMSENGNRAILRGCLEMG